MFCTHVYSSLYVCQVGLTLALMSCTLYDDSVSRVGFMLSQLCQGLSTFEITCFLNLAILSNSFYMVHGLHSRDTSRCVFCRVKISIQSDVSQNIPTTMHEVVGPFSCRCLHISQRPCADKWLKHGRSWARVSTRRSCR